MMLSACSPKYTVINVPDRYLKETAGPTDVPQTFGQAVQAIPEWKNALGQCNADKEAIVKYQEGMK